MRTFHSIVLAAFILLSCTSTAVVADEPRELVVIPQSAQEALAAHAVPVTFKASGFFLAEWDRKQQVEIGLLGIPFEVILRDVDEDRELFLFELHEGEAPPAAWSSLYRSGRNVVVAMDDAQAQHWALKGHHPVRLWHQPHGWGRSSEAALVAYDCTHKPLVAEILGKTTQTQWLDWIEKLSGVESVDIDGATFSIATRYTPSMFSGASNAKGYDFVRQQGQAWGFSGSQLEEDAFASGPGGKNLVLTIPGQTPSEVLLTGHLDSIYQSGNSTISAPGANDNGTGIATLLEAARILRQYRFQRTVKIIFFTGEEQGLYGSAAYTGDHSMGSILGVVNLDMFGWDANGDRCFEIHAGTLPASIDVGNCFRDSIGSYGLALTRDFLTSTATNRSDHASFWNVGVGAIEIAENYFNDGQVGGCVGSEPNPHYHTNNDRIATNMHPPFAFSIAQTALATISAMAIPVEACFASAPFLSASGGVNEVDLAWSPIPGATQYRIYRSTNGCGGNFVAVGETAESSHADPLQAPGTYSYRIEAVAADRCVSFESNCVSATPTVYHASLTSAAYVDACPAGGTGHGNGVVEPGETITMQPTLRNDSDTSLSSLVGTLSSTTPGVTAVDANAAWPDLPPFTSSSTLPDHFRFQVSSAVGCGTSLGLQVGVSAAEGSWAGAFSTLVGTPGFSSGTLASADVPKTIQDNATALSTLAVGTAGSVLDVNVTLSLTHTYDSDLDIFLRGPDGTLVELSTDNGSSGDNFTNTTFDDEAVNPVAGGVAPFSGIYRPEGPLAAFDGRAAAGVWRLEVTDDFSTDTGVLTAWSLQLTTSAPPICNVCSAPPAPPGEPGTSPPLTLSRSGQDLLLEWGAPTGACAPATSSVYRGDLASFALGSYSHDTVVACGVGSLSLQTPIADPLLGEASYLLVVAAGDSEEGSYGRASTGVERPPSAGACRTAQDLSTCP